ncbi:MAG: oligosaccharide flippase family protein [Nanoarchaeota archaeon]
MTDYGTILRRIIWVYALSYLILPVSFVIKAIYARQVNIVDYGLFFGLFAIFGMCALVRDWGLAASSLYHVNKYLVRKEYSKIKTMYWINIAFQLSAAILIALILLSLKGTILTTVFKNEGHISFLFNIFLLYWIIETVHGANMNFLNIFQEQKVAKIFDLCVKIVILVMSLALFAVTQDYQVPVLAYLCSMILITMVSSIYLARRYRHIFAAKLYTGRDLLKEYFTFGSVAVLASISGILFLYTDTFLVQFFLGAEQVGYYTTAYSVAEIIILFVAPLAIITPPIFNRLWHEKDMKQLRSIVQFIFSNLPFIILPISIFFFILAPHIIYFIVGPKFTSSVALLQIFCLYEIIKISTMFMTQLVVAQGKIKKITMTTIIVGIIDLIGKITLINVPWLGAKGAIIMATLTQATFLTVYWLDVRGAMKIKLSMTSILQAGLGAAVFTLITLGLRNVELVRLPSTAWTYLVNGGLTFLAAMTVYVAALYAMRVITKDKVRLVKAMIMRKENK